MVNGAKDWAARSVEGWIIITTGLNEEASEEDLQDLFGEFGDVKNMSMPLNRRTGYVMGYALIEYALKSEAEAAIKGTDGTTFLEKTIHTDFAFTKPPAALDLAVAPMREIGKLKEHSPNMSATDTELPASPPVSTAPELADASAEPAPADVDALVLSLKASLASTQTLLQSQTSRLAHLADVEAELSTLKDQHAFVLAAREAVERQLKDEVVKREVAEEAAEQLRVQVDMLRGQVDQARRGVMQLQKAEKDRRRMSAQVGVGLGATPPLFPIGDELGVPDQPDRSKRASFMRGHRRVSSQSEPDAPSTVLSPPPAPAKPGLRELRLGSVSTSPGAVTDETFPSAPAVPSTEPIAEHEDVVAPAYDPSALEMAQDENTRLRTELLAAHAKLAETEDARAASETCLRALREFMAGSTTGEDAAAALDTAGSKNAPFSIPGLRLPPLPTDRDAEGSMSPRTEKQRWTGFKLWGAAGAGASTKPAPSPALSTAVEPPSAPHSPPARSVASASASVSASASQAPSDRNSVPPALLDEVAASSAAASAPTPLASFVSSWTKGVSPGTPAATAPPGATRKLTSFFRRGASHEKDLPAPPGLPGLEPSPSITERDMDDGEAEAAADESAAHAEMQGIKLPPKPSDSYIPTPEMKSVAAVPSALAVGDEHEGQDERQGDNRPTSQPTPATTASALDDEVETPLTSPKVEHAAGGKASPEVDEDEDEAVTAVTA
ncbi:hypothetical protein Q5752_001250 [Cryptotrichosporon argae]